MLAALKNVLTPAAAGIEPRTRVNRVHNIMGAERVDGLVINVHRGLAYVSWPNGEITIESVKHLVEIVA